MSEINYNDGLWHGWTGGECPVHEKSEIIVKWSCNGVEARNRVRAFSKQDWHDASICAFRVTEPYVEPREFWLYSGSVFSSFERADLERQRDLETLVSVNPIIRVREVLE